MLSKLTMLNDNILCRINDTLLVIGNNIMEYVTLYDVKTDEFRMLEEKFNVSKLVKFDDKLIIIEQATFRTQHNRINIINVEILKCIDKIDYIGIIRDMAFINEYAIMPIYSKIVVMNLKDGAVYQEIDGYDYSCKFAQLNEEQFAISKNNQIFIYQNI